MKLSAIVAEIDYAAMGMSWEECCIQATTLAAQCGYPVPEGGQSPDMEIDEDDSTLIILAIADGGREEVPIDVANRRADAVLDDLASIVERAGYDY